MEKWNAQQHATTQRQVSGLESARVPKCEGLTDDPWRDCEALGKSPCPPLQNAGRTRRRHSQGGVLCAVCAAQFALRIARRSSGCRSGHDLLPRGLCQVEVRSRDESQGEAQPRIAPHVLRQYEDAGAWAHEVSLSSCAVLYQIPLTVTGAPATGWTGRA